MEMKNFIIGLIFFIAASIVILSMVFDMYGSDGYNIDLTNNSDTAYLLILQGKVNDTKINTTTSTNNVWSHVPAQNNSDIQSGDVTEGEMVRSGLNALANIGGFLDIFVTLINGVSDAVGLSPTGAVFWFFTTAIIISVALVLVNSLLRNLI